MKSPGAPGTLPAGGIGLASFLNERVRMKKEMLINVLQPEEIRIAIIEDGVLEELYVERTTKLRNERPGLTLSTDFIVT